MKYSQDALEELSQKISLYDYASRTEEFTKHSGNTHFCICPFHDEDTPSLAIKEDENFFHCFACGKSGNIFTWIMLKEHFTFGQAVQKVADMTGSDINNYIESESMSFLREIGKMVKPKKSVVIDRRILDIEKDYNQKYEAEIPDEWIAEGITEKEIKKYEIRIDKRSNRIVYPVRDADFNMIGVKGRTRFKNYKELNIQKYMNYNKLFIVDYFTGMMQAADDIAAKNEVIIFEGIKSVMKVDSWGFHNAVSAETSVLNEYQIELLIKMQVKNVVIAFDKDVKMEKINEFCSLLKRFTNVFVVVDKWKLLDKKESPCDKSKDIWETLYERRVRI